MKTLQFNGIILLVGHSFEYMIMAHQIAHIIIPWRTVDERLRIAGCITRRPQYPAIQGMHSTQKYQPETHFIVLGPDFSS